MTTELITEAESAARQRAGAQAGLAERWLAKLGVTPAYRKQEQTDENEPGQAPFNPFLPFESLPPIPNARGENRPFGGYAHNVDAGRLYAGTTTQVQGLYPFPAASGARVRGVPFGRHLHTAEPIGLDPSQWLVDGLVTNTGLWVQGQPGIGKSTCCKRLMVGLVAYGFAAVIPGDIKDEYSPIVEALEGKVFRIGRGLHSLNPLDLGPLRGAIRAAVGSHREQLVSQARGRRLDLLESLITIVGGQDLTATERLLLAMAVDQADDASARHHLPDPTIPELVHILDEAGPPLQRVVAARDEYEYRREIRELRNTLVLLCEGPIKGMFDRSSSFSIDADLPAVSLSLKAVEDDGDDVVAAAMMCAWAWSAGLIEGKQATGERRNVFQPQDELLARIARGAGSGGEIRPHDPSEQGTRCGFGTEHALDHRPRSAAHRSRPGQGQGHGRAQRDQSHRRAGQRRNGAPARDQPVHLWREGVGDPLVRSADLGSRATSPRSRQVSDQVWLPHGPAGSCRPDARRTRAL
ncbi:hypothetical protein [Nocardia farcinica]|uniref:hypothetical protein n=1 Tax=Nocardia farcinica TaxID=37329 RepID=UPI001E4D74C3|nr:hypothetical protein [Nocardia farcinica]